MYAVRSLGLSALVVLALGCAALAAPVKDSQPPEAHVNLDAGIAAYEAKDYREAVKQLEIAIVADPKNPEGYFRLAQSQRALGNYRRALKYIRLTLDIEPNHLGALRERGLTLMQAGQPDEAKAALEQLGEKCNRTCSEYESLKQELALRAEKKDG